MHRLLEHPGRTRALLLRFAPLWLALAGVLGWASVAAAFEPDASEQPAEAASPDRVRSAVDASLKLLFSSAAKYTRERECFSCHHQALPALAWRATRDDGWEVDTQAARAQSQFTAAFFEKRRDQLVQGTGVPGGPYSVGYALLGLNADDWPADETTAALVEYLLKTQREKGEWRIGTHRPPLEDSDFAATALSLFGLQKFAPAERMEEVAQRIERSRKWLFDTPANSHEDLVFRTLGLIWAKAPADAVASAASALLATQRDDGGWGQLPDRPSDAYATGQALFALKEAGCIAAGDPAHERGVRWLLDAQLPDGSWLVTTRSQPIQKYFESGFPHGESQFISICGTSWAVIALVPRRNE